MLALKDYEYMYNSIFVESDGILLYDFTIMFDLSDTHTNLFAI
jgi:hypothetical protein